MLPGPVHLLYPIPELNVITSQGLPGLYALGPLLVHCCEHIDRTVLDALVLRCERGGLNTTR
jgi:hypothetical protein